MQVLCGMATVPGTTLQPTWFGHAASTKDALLLFESCLIGNLHHVQRRPHDRERSALIRPGSIFIYEENASGIKRWTDGVSWSPSRILGNFLVYRELDKPFPPGEKKRATKRNKRPSKPGEPYPRPGGDNGGGGSGSALISPTTPPTPSVRPENGYDIKEQERALIGSLVDSYEFKINGLIKKTMSVTVNGVQHHLVSYYTVDAVLKDGLPTPTQDHYLSMIEPRHELMHRQNFRAPLEQVDDGAQQVDGTYTYDDSNGYNQKDHALISNGYNQKDHGFMGAGAHIPQSYYPTSVYAPASTPAYFPQMQPLMPLKHQYTGYDQQLPIATDRPVSQVQQQQIQSYDNYRNPYMYAAAVQYLPRARESYRP